MSKLTTSESLTNSPKTDEETTCPDVSRCSSSGGSEVQAPAKNLPRVTFVYFVQCGDHDGPVKIGIAADVALRLSNMQVGNPYELRLLASIPVSDGRVFESFLHNAFYEDRIRGEWFRWSDRLAEVIVRFPQMESLGDLRELLFQADPYKEPTP